MSGVLPRWPAGTVALLVTEGPHAIPVSAALRAADDRIVLALSPRRESLRRLREHPRVGVALLADGVAVTAYGSAHVVAEPLPGAEGVVGVDVRVTDVADHDGPQFAITGGVPWHWTEEAAEEKDAQVRAALAALARSLPSAP